MKINSKQRNKRVKALIDKALINEVGADELWCVNVDDCPIFWETFLKITEAVCQHYESNHANKFEWVQYDARGNSHNHKIKDWVIFVIHSSKHLSHEQFMCAVNIIIDRALAKRVTMDMGRRMSYGVLKEMLGV